MADDRDGIALGLVRVGNRTEMALVDAAGQPRPGQARGSLKPEAAGNGRVRVTQTFFVPVVEGVRLTERVDG